MSALVHFSSTSFAQFYQQTNLVSDVPDLAAVTDTNLVGAWGTTHSSSSPWWVNTTISGRSLVINGAGQPLPLVVAIPPTNGASATGIIFHGGPGFEVSTGQPSVFIFATLNGTIAGWNPGQSNRNVAVLKVDNRGKAGYTGLTIAQVESNDFLYAANFIQDRVDVFDTNFTAMTLPTNAFMDERLPAGLSVFNVQSVEGKLFVTYAPTNVFAGPGVPGDGFVDVFEPDGTLVRHLRHGPWMNAPWGVTLAPGDFGRFSNRLLVGMFGSGQIAAFDARHGRFRGVLSGTDENPLMLHMGLWGIGFGNGASAGPTNTLYFATDIMSTNGFHGLFGAITAVAGTGPDNDGDQDDMQGEDMQGDDDDSGGEMD